MKNKIDILVDMLRNAIQTGDGGTGCQYNINNNILLVIEEINKILKTCERDLR